MKNKIREKFIAGVLLTAFAVSNVSVAALAAGADNYRPSIRTNDYTSSLDVNTGVRINNADSIVNLSLRDADVKQVLRMFADQAAMNIIFTPSVSGNVTMDLVNISLEKALNLVVSMQNLAYDIQANTLLVGSAGDDLTFGSNSTDMTMVPVKYVSAAALASFLNRNFFNKNSIKPGVSTKPVVTVNSAANELIVMGTRSDVLLVQRIVDKFDKKPAITTFKVNHTTPAEMAGMICSTLIPSFMSQSGGVPAGAAGADAAGAAGGAATAGATGGAASVEGAPTGFASSAGGSSEGLTVGGGKLLCSVDQSASADGMESLPFKNLSVSYFPTLGTIQVIGGSETQLETIRNYIAETDIKAPQAYLEVQIVTLDEEGSKEFSNQWAFRSKNFSFNANGGFTAASDEAGQALPAFLAGHVFGSKVGDSVTKYSRWSSSPALVYTVNYLVENKKGRLLANPKVILTSGQQSVIDLTSDYVSKVTSQYLDNGGMASQVQKDYDIQNDLGIKVTITPFISPDGYVTLDINPDYSTIYQKIYSGSEVVNEQDLAATLLKRQNLDLKGVRIKDGETLVIGGLIQETETKSVSKVPFLGDIPLLGVFFRSTKSEKAKEEMVIMLTPQIILDSDDTAYRDDTAL